MPFHLAVGDGDGPVEEVADVGQDLAGGARGFGGAEGGEVRRRVAQRFGAAVGERGEDVAEEFDGGGLVHNQRSQGWK